MILGGFALNRGLSVLELVLAYASQGHQPVFTDNLLTLLSGTSMKTKMWC